MASTERIHDPRDIFSVTVQSTSAVRPPYYQQPASPSPRRRKNSQKRAQEDEECNEDSALEYLKQKAIRGDDISRCDKTLLPDLIVALKQARNELISNGHFSESEAAHKALNLAEQMEKEWRKKESQKQLQESIKQRIQEAKNDQKNMEEMIRNQERNMERMFGVEQADLQLVHERELAKLEAEWKSPEKQRRYNKASPQLKALRLQQERLLNTREYEASRIIEKVADELEAQEIDKNHANMEFDYQCLVKAVMDRQADEIKKLKDVQSTKRMAYQSAKNHELGLIEQRIKKIEIEQEKAKNINHVERLMKKYSQNRTGISEEKPDARSFRHSGKKEIVVSEFNELTLPPLRQSIRAQNATKRVMQKTAQAPKRSYRY